jgi:hypothetical protein
VSPTPKSLLSTKPIDSRRNLNKEEKHTLRTMMIDERDAELFKEFIEEFHSN